MVVILIVSLSRKSTWPTVIRHKQHYVYAVKTLDNLAPRKLKRFSYCRLWSAPSH